MTIEPQIKLSKRKFVRYTINGAFFLSLLFCQCSPGKKSGSGGNYKYDRFQSSDLPAYVEAIIFSTGHKLSSSSSLNWGNWTISFPSGQLPVATSMRNQENPGGNGNMSIVGLKASNPVEGWGFDCSMQFCRGCSECAQSFKPPSGKNAPRHCCIRIYSGSERKAEIYIDCPVDVQMK